MKKNFPEDFFEKEIVANIGHQIERLRFWWTPYRREREISLVGLAGFEPVPPSSRAKGVTLFHSKGTAGKAASKATPINQRFPNFAAEARGRTKSATISAIPGWPVNWAIRLTMALPTTTPSAKWATWRA